MQDREPDTYRRIMTDTEIERLKAAAQHAKQTIMRYISHQVSHQDSYVEMRNAYRALKEALNVNGP